jgi:hypothetical protein
VFKWGKTRSVAAAEVQKPVPQLPPPHIMIVPTVVNQVTQVITPSVTIVVHHTPSSPKA